MRKESHQSSFERFMGTYCPQNHVVARCEWIRVGGTIGHATSIVHSGPWSNLKMMEEQKEEC